MAKVTVSFVTEEDDSRIKIEADPVRNTDYTGKLRTRFRYGDTAYFRVYSHEPEKLEVITTDGVVSDLGIFSGEPVTETLLFITDQTVNTEKPVKSILTKSWLGQTLGGLSIQDSYTLKAGTAPSPENGVIAAAQVSYMTLYRLYGITLGKRDFDEYPVMAYVRVKNV